MCTRLTTAALGQELNVIQDRLGMAAAESRHLHPVCTAFRRAGQISDFSSLSIPEEEADVIQSKTEANGI